jgi:hypothetical protein
VPSENNSQNAALSGQAPPRSGHRLRRGWAALVLVGCALFAGGCGSTIVPMRPLQTVEEWVPASTTAPATQTASTEMAPTTESSATQVATTAAGTQSETMAAATATSEPATMAAATATAPTTALAATTTAATRPGMVKRIRVIDPNQTVRFVYKARRQRIWDRAEQLLVDMGYVLDRQDYRLGALTTREQLGAQIIEPWRPDQTGAKSALENTTNEQRRRILLTIKAVPEKPDFYEIAVQVVVERASNPTENLSGIVFQTGSGFGGSPILFRSDYSQGLLSTQLSNWVLMGHDPALEKKILDKLFKQI